MKSLWITAVALAIALPCKALASEHVVVAKFAGMFDVMERQEVCGYSYADANRHCGFGPVFKYIIPKRSYRFKHRVCVFLPPQAPQGFSYWGCANYIPMGNNDNLQVNIYVQPNDFVPPWPGVQQADLPITGDNYVRPNDNPP